MIRTFALILSLGLVGCGSPSSDLDSINEVAILAATCSGCHAPDDAQAIVSLDGYSVDALRQSLLLYQTDEGNSAMHRIARGYSADEIEQIATYLGDTGEGL
ncbi:MAG: cytochrome c [Pseudomonadota bacterium]